MVKEKYKCEICGKMFTPKSNADLYCGINCLNASINDFEQEAAIRRFTDEQTRCPICLRHKKFLVHKRMNGNWYLYQEYHYNYDKESIKTCYFCNLWEKDYRKRNNRNKDITPDEHRRLIGKDKSYKQ